MYTHISHRYKCVQLRRSRLEFEREWGGVTGEGGGGREEVEMMQVQS